jgi:hypothetical protein
MARNPPEPVHQARLQAGLEAMPEAWSDRRLEEGHPAQAQSLSKSEAQAREEAQSLTARTLSRPVWTRKMGPEYNWRVFAEADTDTPCEVVTAVAVVVTVVRAPLPGDVGANVDRHGVFPDYKKGGRS